MTFGHGRHRIAVPTFEERHGLHGAMVAPTKIIAGLGASLGMRLLSCPGATGDYRTDFSAKVPSPPLFGRCVCTWLTGQQPHRCQQNFPAAWSMHRRMLLVLLQAAAVADALISGECDFAFLHVKAVDDTGHDRAAALKVAPLLHSPHLFCPA